MAQIRVVRIVDAADLDRRGFGVEFTEMNPQSLDKLFRLVELAAQGQIGLPPRK